jgi:polysaccharide export outer membrane protein
LHCHDKWWMFTAGMLDHASPNETLWLFFADSPLGPWTAHPKNPIVSDARHARPAGCLYFDNGQLIRPGQDCSKGYGYAVQLHQVSVLSETDYQETLLTSIPPDWIPGCRGIHTLNQNTAFRVIDCKFLISRFDFSLFFSSFRGSEAHFGNSFAREPAKEFKVIMSYLARATTHVFRFSLTFLLLGTLASGQTGSPQVPLSPVRAATMPTPISPGQNGAAVHVMSAEGSGGGGQTDSVGTSDDAVDLKATTPSPPTASGDLGFEILIGPGDLIEVSVYGASDYIKDVRVRSTGEITLPLAGTVRVGGLTPAQAEALIAKRLSDGDFFNDPRVSVLEKEFVTQGISVLGEVQKPGVYPLPGPRKLFDALSAAGGTTPRAGNTVSVLHRADSKHAEIVNLSYDGKSSRQSNIYVYPGDTIVISKAGVVYVVGDVRLPGGFVMENSHMTILQAFAMAQGPNSTAALDRAKLIRKARSENQPQETLISLKKILSAKSPDINLQPDDILFVPSSGTKAVGRRTLEAIVQTATGMAIYSRVP